MDVKYRDEFPQLGKRSGDIWRGPHAEHRRGTAAHTCRPIRHVVLLTRQVYLCFVSVKSKSTSVWSIALYVKYLVLVGSVVERACPGRIS
jgi:hypothetical protein